MKTSVWGPSAWRFLHAVTFAYPDAPTEEQQAAARQLFQSLRQMIPCGDCCGHYCTEIQSHPPQVQSRDALSRWLVDLHNRVNARLGKPSYSYSVARAEYTQEESQCLLPSEPCGDARPKPQPGRRVRYSPRAMPTNTFTICVLAVLCLAFVVSLRSRRR
jgi:FAD-linked sulfhydryl oxidase